MPFTQAHTELLAPLFAALPLDAAMPSLSPKHPASADAVAVAKQLVAAEPLRRNAAAQSALWLYVDDLDRSHRISQDLHDSTGSYLHGIMHRREGDFWNSHYWMRQAGSHPVWNRIPGYDPDHFIDAVAAAKGKDSTDLLTLQRAEWAEVMAYCLG